MSNIIHVSTIIQNTSNEILLVLEGKKGDSYGKLNLPGGHLEICESIIDGAKREVKEETGLDVKIDSIIGIYVGYGTNLRMINFIFSARTDKIFAKPMNDEIIECKWFSIEELSCLEHDKILNPRKLMKVVKDFYSDVRIPLEVINDNIYG